MTTENSEAMRTLRRPPRWGAAAVLLIAAACSSSPAPRSLPVTGLGTEVPQATTSTTATTIPEAPDPSALLSSALSAYAAGYEFDATATVNDEVATRVTGRWIGGAGQFLVASGDGEVEYLVTPDGEWIRTPGEAWLAAADAGAVGDPLGPLRSPLSLEMGSWDGVEAVVGATYDGDTVAGGSDPVTVSLVFVGGVLTQARYQRESDGVMLVSITSFSPLTDTTPITVPSTP